MAQDMGVALEFVQVPATGRIPALLAGRSDVTIASISVTTDRAKAVMFCNPNGALKIVILAPQSLALKTPADLAGKRIGITRATLEEATVPKMAPKETNIVWFDDITATIQALLSGQVDAVAMTSFAGKAMADGNPDKHIEEKLTVTTAYYGPIVRPGDFELRQWINTWLFLNDQNGTLAAIYKQYTGLDLPPCRGFDPASDALHDATASFETRRGRAPQDEDNSVGHHEKNPHPEEPAPRASRRTHRADPAAAKL